MLIVPILWRDVEAIEPCKISTRKYYSRIEQKFYPPHPTRGYQQSEIWAKKREEIGGAYYIADYCENGDIIEPLETFI